MAQRINRTIGAFSSPTRKPITQHQYKVREDVSKVRAGLVNFYKYEVEQGGREIIPDKALTLPTDMVAMWMSRRTEDETRKHSIVVNSVGHPPRVYGRAAYRIVEDTKPWLCMCGYVGTGKTTMLRAISEMLTSIQTVDDGKFRSMAPFSFRYITATELAEVLAESKATYHGIRNIKLLLIDDVGREPKEILDYGNALYPFIDLMQYRYENGLGTIFTTNLTGAELRERYGERIADRMREKCFFVSFEGQSFRPERN